MTKEVKVIMFEYTGNLLYYTLKIGSDTEQVLPSELTDVIDPSQLERVTLS